MAVADYDLRKYVGRNYESYNCLDLVKEFYKDFFGLKVQDYYEGETPNRHHVESLIKTCQGDFIKVGDPKFGDLVVIRLYGLECHLGVYITDQIFLHSAKNIGSNLDRLNRYARMIAGYYRHREQTA